MLHTSLPTSYVILVHLNRNCLFKVKIVYNMLKCNEVIKTHQN